MLAKTYPVLCITELVHEMYALSVKKDSAHEDCIWSCDWGKVVTATPMEEEGGSPPPPVEDQVASPIS